jgi:predicted RNA-binding protein with PUA-like domain
VGAIKAILKTEPSDFSFDDLQREGKTVWSGIHNFVALKNLETLKVGDAVAIYHTGNERAMMGIAIVTRAAYRPRAEPHSKFRVVDLRAGRRFARPVTLEDLKKEPVFQDSLLLTMGRISVVPLTAEQSEVLDRLSRVAAPGGGA